MNLKTEPVAIIGAVIAALVVVQDALSNGLSLGSIILPAVIAALTALQRSKVYPSASVRDISVESYLQGAYDTVVDGKPKDAPFSKDESAI